MIIPDFIEELVEAGISVTLQKGNKFRIEGFYKSSGVTIENINAFQQEWVANARYNEVTRIESLRDIVELNYYWWDRSKGRSEYWEQPDPLWVPLLLQFKFIAAKTISEQTIYE